MNLTEVRERLYDATALFFGEASVIWAEQVGTKPEPPCVTLKMGSISRAAFHVEDGEGVRSYQCSTIAEVNLYTRGRPVTEGKAVTGNCINTATADLMEFSCFLESEAISDCFTDCGMSVLLMPPIRDLTLLQNDSKYRYRAMAEYAVTFVEEAGGRYGLSGMRTAPNSSGGGTEEMVKEPVGVIEDFELKEEEDEEQSIG